MNQPKTVETTSDDRVLAALAYFFGIFGALIIWAVRRDKSRFVSFHSLQALAFEGVVMVLSFGLSLCVTGAMFLGMALTMGVAVSQNSSPDAGNPYFLLSSLLPFGMFACMMPFFLLLLGIRLFAAASVASGRDIHFPWLGKRVEAFLGN